MFFLATNSFQSWFAKFSLIYRRPIRGAGSGFSKASCWARSCCPPPISPLVAASFSFTSFVVSLAFAAQYSKCCVVFSAILINLSRTRRGSSRTG